MPNVPFYLQKFEIISFPANSLNFFVCKLKNIRPTNMIIRYFRIVTLFIFQAER